MNHLEEARKALRDADQLGTETTPSQGHLQLAIAHALLAIAERLPAPVEWTCRECGHTWRGSRQYDGERPCCPKCGDNTAIKCTHVEAAHG
jgi:rubrerythrin